MTPNPPWVAVFDPTRTRQRYYVRRTLDSPAGTMYARHPDGRIRYFSTPGKAENWADRLNLVTAAPAKRV